MNRSCYKMVSIVLLIFLTTGCSETLLLKPVNQSNEMERLDESLESTSNEKMTTLTIELFDRNNTPIGAPPITNNKLTKYIQEQFGDPNHIKVEFVPVPRSEEVEKLNVLLKANQAPDLVFTYSKPVFSNLVSQDALTDLTALIDEYGQDLKEVLGEELLKYGVYDGKQYAIPAKRVLRAQSTTLIREDWLKEVGLPLPRTTEEFYKALKAFKDQIPEKAGEEIIPFSLIDQYHLAPLVYSFWEWDRITDEDLYANPTWVMPGNKEAFRLLNRMYQEGLLDPNFAFDREMKQFLDAMINGRIGAASPNTNEPVYMGYLAELQKSNPEAILTPIDPFTNVNGKKPKPITDETGMYIMVPKYSNNAEAAVKYLNWMAQPEHYMMLQNGIEGENYVIQDGVPIALENEETKHMMYNYYDYCIIINGKLISPTDNELNIRANAFDPRYEKFTVKSIEYGTNDGIETSLLSTTIESEIKYSDILEEKSEEIFVKVITVSSEEFDVVYDKEVDDYMRMGGELVMKEKRRLIELDQ